ncbi:hypothetical protein PUN28_002711 [Cardiocondyla obscurior]|uniref:Secreted protein n=1 Tax=Cardiocondyla obscurior TaxID=286306 RepID=A0AAW2GVT0_9HYME
MEIAFLPVGRILLRGIVKLLPRTCVEAHVLTSTHLRTTSSTYRCVVSFPLFLPPFPSSFFPLSFFVARYITKPALKRSP